MCGLFILFPLILFGRPPKLGLGQSKANASHPNTAGLEGEDCSRERDRDRPLRRDKERALILDGILNEQQLVAAAEAATGRKILPALSFGFTAAVKHQQEIQVSHRLSLF